MLDYYFFNLIVKNLQVRVLLRNNFLVRLLKSYFADFRDA